MTLAPWRWLFGALVLLVGLGLLAWFTLLRPAAQADTNDPAAVFNYASIGNEEQEGIPYWIWRVLPKVFADHLPRDGAGYSSLGVHWEQGSPVPVGFSRTRIGAIDRVAPNCAFCHQGSYRLAPEDPPHLVSAGAGSRVDPQAYTRFLAAVGRDPRFTADTLMREITTIYDMPLWERLTYRYVLIPRTRQALADQDAAWQGTRPYPGAGRVDALGDAKFHKLGLGEDGTIGTSRIMPLWNLAAADPTPLSRSAYFHDGLLTDLDEAALAEALRSGMTRTSWHRTESTLEAIADFIRHQAPPPSPFSPDLPRDDPFQVEPVLVARGAEIFARDCAGCHGQDGHRTRTVIPTTEVATDRHRIDAWTEPARDALTAYEAGYDWGFDHVQQFEGYTATPLDGLWLRAPYLHNGSVPNLRAMLTPPEDRPETFWIGSDLIDAENGGFVSTKGGDPVRRLSPFDTTQPGNSNAGHAWGTDLNPTAREALLAYLKTL